MNFVLEHSITAKKSWVLRNGRKKDQKQGGGRSTADLVSITRFRAFSAWRYSRSGFKKGRVLRDGILRRTTCVLRCNFHSQSNLDLVGRYLGR